MAGGAALVNVTELINGRKTGAYQKSVIALCALVAMLDGVDSQMIAPTGPSIAATLHVSPVAMAPIYSAGQFGYLIGALCFGPIADRIGRKSMLVLTTTAFALCTLLTATATSFDILLSYRIIAGLGLGGAAPCFVALASEYGPRRIRAQIVAFMWAAVPLGGLFGTFAIAFMLPRYGWPSVYYLFGSLTLIVAALLALRMPESLGFLAARGAEPRRMQAIVERIAPGLASAAAQFTISEERLPGVPVKHLFTQGRGVPTLFLWLASFLGWMVLIVVAYWTPTLMQQAGNTVALATLILAFDNIGSVIGSTLVGRIIDRYGPFAVLIAAFIGSAIFNGAMGFVAWSFPLACTVMTVAGFFAGASGTGVVAVSALIYPLDVRSTGVGWTIAIGRIGAVTGPLAAGALLAAHWTVVQVFLAVGIPALCGAATIFLLRQYAQSRGGLVGATGSVAVAAP
jgi:AAHS family 4-hydroxybenzoate transporter-like MFS transporter